MGRGYIVEESVEGYLSNLSSAASCLTGLLIGQSSAQRDFVVLAVQTPGKESAVETENRVGLSSLDGVDVEWVSEHARQVSRMLPGGVCVLGLFLVTPPELAKEAQNTLKKLLFAVEKCLSKSRLWDWSEDDVTDRVALHICSKTKKAVCKTFDVKDPKCSAKPADWRYQASVSSCWSKFSCAVDVELQIPVTTSSPQDWYKCIKDGLKRWAKRIENGVCLINGKPARYDSELLPAPKKNAKTSQQQTFQAQILVPAEAPEAGQRASAEVKVCNGSVCVRGAVSCRAYVHTNKPKTRHAVQAIMRDAVNTVSNRVETLLEDLQMTETGPDLAGQQLLPRRVFAALPGSALSLCDYVFPDEAAADVAERFKEMLDVELREDDVEVDAEARVCCSAFGSGAEDGGGGGGGGGGDDDDDADAPHAPTNPSTETASKLSTQRLYAVAAVVVGVLSSVASLLYFTESL